MKTFQIGIPTLNRKDLLEESLVRYQNDFPDVKIHIVDNGNQDILIPRASLGKYSIYTQPTNLGVSTSWNLLCREIFKENDYALILNDDIYLGYDKSIVDEAIQIAMNNRKHLFIRSEMSWSMFLISKELFSEIGGFDELFHPAYYEDSDYIYRMNLAGIQQSIIPSLNPRTYRISGTYEKAPELVNMAMQSNKERYIEKWGGLPLLEQYEVPYGEPNPKNTFSHWNRAANIIHFEVLNSMVKVWQKNPTDFKRFGSDGQNISFVDFPGGPMICVGENLIDWVKKSMVVTRIVPYGDFIILETNK